MLIVKDVSRYSKGQTRILRFARSGMLQRWNGSCVVLSWVRDGSSVRSIARCISGEVLGSNFGRESWL